MKHIEMLLATGTTIQEAVKSMSDQLNKDYADKACQVQQIFFLNQVIPLSQIAATPTGQPQMQMVIHLVAVLTEEPELDSLQRNFKPVFDFVNENRDDLIPMIIGYLATAIGLIPEDVKKVIEELKSKR